MLCSCLQQSEIILFELLSTFLILDFRPSVFKIFKWSFVFVNIKVTDSINATNVSIKNVTHQTRYSFKASVPYLTP